MKSLFKKGVGSLAYRDRWHLFDQILVSQDRQTPRLFFLLKRLCIALVFSELQTENIKGILLGRK